jgi:hypothetical protein
MKQAFKKSILASGLAAALALGLSVPAGATPIGQGLTSGVLNTIEDQDREAYIDNGDGVLGIGDVFVGFVRLDNFLPSGKPGGNTVYGVISNQITAVNVGGDPTVFSLGTTTKAGLTLAELTGNANAAGGMFAIYDNVPAADLIANSISATNIFGYINYITTGSLELVAGIVSADNYLMVDNTAAFPAGVSNALFPTLTASITTGGFSGGLDVVYNGLAGWTFTDTVVTFDALGNVHTTSVGIGNGAVRGASGDGNEGAFTNAPGYTQCTVPNTAGAPTNTACGFITKADFFVAPIPEPGTLALLGAGLLSALGLRRRKEKV